MAQNKFPVHPLPSLASRTTNSFHSFLSQNDSIVSPF